ncbi:coma-domain-containing protein [Amylocystis lapponica]|nr:coma-domain-containing protein [Amylocystis lapponica]
MCAVQATRADVTPWSGSTSQIATYCDAPLPQHPDMLAHTLRRSLPNAPRPHRALSTTAPRLNSVSSPFSFLPANSLHPKPGRSKGITEIRGPYYAPTSDGVKFAGGAFTLMPEDRLRALIDTCHKHGCYVSTGGFIERVLSSSGGNKQVISNYLTTCKNMGFDVLEISSGFLSIPTEDWASLVEFTAAHGLKPKPEVGIQWGAGGDASIEELESAGTRDPKWLIDRANTFLQAGATYMIMIESEGITENVKNWRTDVISAITSALPRDKIMFEAADPDVFAYHIQNQGARANLFIDHSQIVQLACLRRGIWGTGSTFARVVTTTTSAGGDDGVNKQQRVDATRMK